MIAIKSAAVASIAKITPPKAVNTTALFHPRKWEPFLPFDHSKSALPGNQEFYHRYCFVGCYICLQLLLYNKLLQGKELSNNETNTIIWWTRFITLDRIKTCKSSVCKFTANRSSANLENAKAFLFYGSSFNQSDLPLPRGDKIWALFHEESPRNVPLFSHEEALILFNLSSTFSRYSDLPLTLQFLPSLDNITSVNHYKTFEEKTEFQNTLAPVIYLQSDCSTPINRNTYVEELMKYIKIDSYGKCLNNKQLPDSLQDAMKTFLSSELIEFISRYKFSIAFENGICEDYITEKLWRPIVAGSLPIYIGSPSINDWLPNNNTVIYLSDFKSPKELARHLLYLNNNKTAYDSHFEHKIQRKIINDNLKKNFRQYWTEQGLGVIDEFECLVCESLTRPGFNVVRKKHYDCPQPISIVDFKNNITNYWLYIYKTSKCEAVTLKKFVEENRSVDNQFPSDTRKILSDCIIND
ncbi:alpha-(1,3)-fucosyltransferase B-like [Cimex lectularius]|uniref:Fucosyltransferase n=1 Tax=Cimex lectularius TaxID=79782 RepID=A0A8I6THV8_CIMLE|nr:alpha-(1,3)-fucosyltransferase B-like [Cimex lectularius]